MGVSETLVFIFFFLRLPLSSSLAPSLYLSISLRASPNQREREMGGCSSKGNDRPTPRRTGASTEKRIRQRQGRKRTLTPKVQCSRQQKKTSLPAAPPPPAGPNAIRGVGAAAAEPRTPLMPRVKLVLLGDSVRA